MKLTIKNFKKIIGRQLDGWVVEDVMEDNEHYSFLCRCLKSELSIYGHISNVRLIREGVDEGEWKYRFWKPSNYPAYHQVTADYFSDIRNACSMIEIELKKDFNNPVK